MKEYLLFMDVSGDVARNYVDEGKVKLLPMEFIINNQAHLYTAADDGIDVKQFYSMVKTRADIKTTQITPAIYEDFFEPYLKDGY